MCTTSPQAWTRESSSKLLLALAVLLLSGWSDALGQTTRIVNAWIGEDRRFVLQHATDPNFYYILRKGDRSPLFRPPGTFSSASRGACSSGIRTRPTMPLHFTAGTGADHRTVGY